MDPSKSNDLPKLILRKNLNFNEEKLKKIDLFVNNVLTYNQKYNLISRSTERDIWSRHILDSAQLVKHIDSDKFKSLSDLGTGAGFPGIILSIFFSDVITFHVKLYEKSNVKIDFLKDQIRSLQLNNVSLYDNDYQSHKLSSDYFVFRAFKRLTEILRISRETIIGPHKLIVMMGKSAQDQLNKASKADINKYKLVPSITSNDSKILLLDGKK
tara:strand:- start:232 stop:870 length:639 start_codon:yes stop_codon:yes gene_type:complete